MAEPKKKPTPRKAPKGPLDGSGSAAKKAQRKAVKAALAKMGLIGPTVRLPLWQLSPEADARLEAAMKGAGILG